MYVLERFKTIEKQKETFKDRFEEKANILLLKKDPESRVKWPWTPPRSFKNEIKQAEAHKIKISKHSRPLYRKKSLLPSCLVKPSKSRKHVSLQEVHDRTNHEVSDLVGGFLFQNCKNIDTRKSESIQGLSLDLLDNMFVNLANISLPVIENEAELDWEYVMGNMLKLGLPQTVIDRVSERMKEANKSSSAITAMNVTRPLLSDLTITTAEVEMQQEIQRLVAENEAYESKPEDEPFEDSVKWLVDLDRKDQYSKDKEIEEIHLDYTNLLNKKGA